MSEELKPCPFCGNKPEQRDRDGLSRTGMWHIIFCNTCDVEVEVGMTTLEEAIDTWNTRAEGWISVDDRLPPDDKRRYPILDTDSCGDFIYGTVIRSDYDDRATDHEQMCRIEYWLDCPIPDPPEAKP